MVQSQAPTIANIKNNVSIDDARALLSIAVCEVCDFFNVGKNMNDTQIALTVDLIIEQFWYFKLDEIKYCFRRAMMCGKLFDRLDGNIIIGWLREYDTERTEEAMRISEKEEAYNSESQQSEGITFNEYKANLRRLAESGDGGAKARLLDIEESQNKQNQFKSQDQEKENAFKKWKEQYTT